MGSEMPNDPAVSWVLVYTKAHAETWADTNLRSQGFSTVYPRVASRVGRAPLFPRYLFVGFHGSDVPRALSGTYGVHSVVEFNGRPARVPREVLLEVASRMNEHGMVVLDATIRSDPLFARRERERVTTLIKLAQAGFRVRTGSR
jgi:hypothetical protein